MLSPRRILLYIAATLLLAAAAMPALASSVVTIAEALTQPDGATVYLDDVCVAKIRAHQNPEYFVVREQYRSSMIIISGAPSDLLNIGQDVDIEGTMTTLPSGLRAITDPRVIGYYSYSGALLTKCPKPESLLKAGSKWQWKADLPAASNPNVGGDPVAGEPNLDLPPPPVRLDSVATLLDSGVPGTSALLECKRILGKSSDPVYGDYLLIADDFSFAAVKVYCGSQGGPGAASFSTAGLTDERVSEVSGQVAAVDGQVALFVAPPPPGPSPVGGSGSLQIVYPGSTAYAKTLTDGSETELDNVVVTDYNPESRIAYIEDRSRMSGLRVNCVDSVAVQTGDAVTLTGTVRTTADGERELKAATVYASAHSVWLAPLALIARDLGGGAANALTPGITSPAPAYGLNNKGVLVRMYGQVIEVNAAAGYFRLSDGSRTAPPQSLLTPAKVVWNMEGGCYALPAVGDAVACTGISSSEAVADGKYSRLLRLRYFNKPVVTGTSHDGYVQLLWTAQSLATYNVYRADAPAGPYSLIANVKYGGYADTGLVNGQSYYYKVCATDSGVVGAASDYIKLSPSDGRVIPHFPPVSSIDLDGTLGNNDWFVSPVTVTISATDADNDFSKSFYKLDDMSAAWSEYSTPILVDSSGEHQVAAYSNDTNGNSEDPDNPVTSSFKIDSAAPTITKSLSSAPNGNGWYSKDVVISYSAVDSVSGLALPQAADPSVPLNFITTLNTEGAGLSDTKSATDVAGNVGMSTVTGINIDKTAPVLGVVSVPTGCNHVINFDKCMVKFTATDTLSGIDGQPWVVVAITPSVVRTFTRDRDRHWGPEGGQFWGWNHRSGWLKDWMKRDSDQPADRRSWDPFVARWLQDCVDHKCSDSFCDDTWGQAVISWLHDRVDNQCSDDDQWNEPSLVTYPATKVGTNTYQITFDYDIPGSYEVRLFAQDKAGNKAQSVTPIRFSAGGFTVDWLEPLSTMENYTMEDGSTLPVKFRLRDPANINNYVDNCLYTVKVIDDADKVWKQVKIPDIDMLLGAYSVNIKTKDANNVDWPVGDYTIVIEGPGIWDVLAGPYRSRYGFQLVEKAVAKGKGRK